MEMKSCGGFSLVEVVIALAVASFALIAIVALLPMGLQSANDAVSDTRSSMIAQDVAARLRTIPGTATLGGSGSPTTITGLTTNWFYDVNGNYQSNYYSTAVYRVDVNCSSFSSYPPNTNPKNQDANNVYSSQLQAAVVTVGWPVNPGNGTLPSGRISTNTYTFYLRVVPNL